MATSRRIPPADTVTKSSLTRSERLRHFTSLREFLDALRDLGDLREVDFEVDTNLEIGAIVRRVHETYAPAPLFTNIRGYGGYRVVGAPLAINVGPWPPDPIMDAPENDLDDITIPLMF